MAEEEEQKQNDYIDEMWEQELDTQRGMLK